MTKNILTLTTSIILAAAAAPSAAQALPRPSEPAAPAHRALAALAAMPAPPGSPGGAERSEDDRADELYERARDLIEEGRYDRAIAELDRLIALNSSRTDSAYYWKAYSLAKLGQRAESLAAIGELTKRFANSRWLKDAKALEVELRQSSGQTVSPSSQEDDELKLMALRGLMQSDPEQALPIIEKMLAGTNSPKVKERALFVLSQANSSRARVVISGIARGNGNPDLQLKAIKYLGIMGGQENRQLLADIYRSSTDSSVKRAILHSYMVAGDRERLLQLAKSENDQRLRGDAVHQLGVMGARAELAQLYQAETAIDVKKRILQAMFVGGDADRMIELARNERDPELRKTAIHNLGLMRRQGTSEALLAIYRGDSNPDVRRAVINALFLQNNGAALVSLARAEKDVELKKEMVQKMSVMSPKSKEVSDYLMELLK
jgi:HEAT repeat protein